MEKPTNNCGTKWWNDREVSLLKYESNNKFFYIKFSHSHFSVNVNVNQDVQALDAKVSKSKKI